MELKEALRVQAEEKEKLDIKILKTERRNIKLLCQMKSIKKKSSDREKEIASVLNKKFEEITRDTKTFLEIYK